VHEPRADGASVASIAVPVLIEPNQSYDGDTPEYDEVLFPADTLVEGERLGPFPLTMPRHGSGVRGRSTNGSTREL
jgi:hypothetical protein